jgi:hypothetical protein
MFMMKIKEDYVSWVFANNQFKITYLLVSSQKSKD